MKPLLKSLLFLIIVLGSLTMTTNQALAWLSVQVGPPQYINADGEQTATITATIRRGDGGPIGGQNVTFSITSSPAVGSLNPLSATTNSSGQAKTVYSQPTIPTPSIVGIMASVTINVNGIPQTFYATGYVYLVKVEIEGPNLIALFKTNTPQITLSAIVDPPGNGKYSWEIVSGGDKIQLISATAENAVIQAINKSTAKNDVDIKLTYIINLVPLEAHHLLTVQRPTKLTKESLQFIRREEGYGKMIIGTWIGFILTGTLRDQFGDPMAGVLGTEEVQINWLDSKPKKFLPFPQTGSIPTNSSGNYRDACLIPMPGKAPPNTHIVTAQTLTFGGYSGYNLAIINYSSATVSYPIDLE